MECFILVFVKDKQQGAITFTSEFLNSREIADLPPQDLKNRIEKTKIDDYQMMNQMKNLKNWMMIIKTCILDNSDGIGIGTF